MGALFMKPEYDPDDMPDIRRLTNAEKIALARKMHKNILNAFDEIVLATEDWLTMPSTEAFFKKQSERLAEFMQSSGIRNQWQNIIDKRATQGADIVEEIYNYAKKVGTPDALPEYTQAEKIIVNNLCDYNYELIQNVTQEQISNIRGRLIDDFGNGVNPRQTNLKEMQELPGIRGWSPEYRAELIARTETARATNTATLQNYANNGARYVELIVNTDCDECNEHAGQKIPIEEALNEPIFHPNCKCTWVAAKDDTTGLRF